MFSPLSPPPETHRPIPKDARFRTAALRTFTNRCKSIMSMRDDSEEEDNKKKHTFAHFAQIVVPSWPCVHPSVLLCLYKHTKTIEEKKFAQPY